VAVSDQDSRGVPMPRAVLLGGLNETLAIAAVQAGKATRIQICVRHATEAEVETANERAAEAAWKAGPRAFLKYLGLVKATSPDPPEIRRRKLTE
jgi:hypothetical protein